MNNLSNILFYAVRNKDGLWFKKSKRSCYKDNWVKEFEKARIYTRIVDARRVVTTVRGDDDIPGIVVFKVTEVRTIDDSERQDMRQDKEEKREKRRRVKKAKMKLGEAEKEYESCNKS